MAALWRDSRPASDRQSALPAATKSTASVDDRLPRASRADSALADDCQERIDGLLMEFPLKFDQQSEMLKAEVQQVVYAAIEVFADCPQATLEIRATHAQFSSANLRNLIERRASYLQSRFAAGGVRTRIVSRDMAADAGVKPSAAITLGVIP